MPANAPDAVVSRGTVEQPAWLLTTANTAMALSLGPADALRLDHWGPRGGGDWSEDAAGTARTAPRAFLDGTPLAYPVYGDATFKEPCLAAVFADGTRVIQLAFCAARTIEHRGQPTLELDFVDLAHQLVVTHRFVVYPEHDLIARSVRLRNLGSAPIRLERALSAGLAWPPGAYRAWTLHGTWGREFQLHGRDLGPGKTIVDSRRGFSSHEANPWFAVGPAATPATAPVSIWFGALAWSGNWTIAFEVEANDALSVVAGIDPFDSAWHLAPGEELETPELIGGYTNDGLDGASALLQRFERERVLPERHRTTPRPILYNSWYATTFEVRVDQQIALARRAADLGVELFVVDDGWFRGRVDDRAGLGDWQVDPAKFPNGLDELIDAVRALGLRFGIWVEPEMVNPDSDLYRAHPDWVFHVPGAAPTFWRGQLVLNFAREDVRANVLGQLRALLGHHRIDFVKWDCNRPITEAGWSAAAPERQREVWVRHVRGVYDVLAALRAEFPNLLIENCCSGGGRADLAMLGLTDQVWVSDNTDAGDRLAMHYGYSRAYPAATMVQWVTDVPDGLTGRTIPLTFRFHVAMQGVLGIGGNLLDWDSAELDAARELIAQYRAIRPLVQLGHQHWLLPPSEAAPCVVQYVAQDRSATVVLAYHVRGRALQGATRVRLRGLDPNRRYRRPADGAESSGAVLMGAGLPILAEARHGRHPGDWRSELQHWIAAE